VPAPTNDVRSQFCELKGKTLHALWIALGRPGWVEPSPSLPAILSMSWLISNPDRSTASACPEVLLEVVGSSACSG